MTSLRCAPFAALMLALAACQPAVAPAPPATSPATASDPLGTFKANALIMKVEDAGYPMSSLMVDLGDNKGAVPMLFNNEYAVKKPADLEVSSLAGKRANISYTRKTELDMATMLVDGKDVLHHEPGDPASNPKLSVTGKLTGVKELSHGDLPDKLVVTDSAGKTYEFEAFVSEPAVVAANGQTVTVGYDEDVQTHIDEISPAP
ncbi:MAG TPA: hypothetical protein VG942_14280 [Hyphomonadaceae bacterium]|nr:hypothetical protein [Hyphomonadaceae bacterium]